MQRLNLDTVVWDNHTCVPLCPNDTGFLDRLVVFRASGVNVVSINVACGRDDFTAAKSMLSALRAWLEARPEDYLLVSKAADAEAAKHSGRLGVCFDVEGGDALSGDLGNVEKLYALGVRWMLPSYNLANELGGGCLAEDGGLTSFGRRVVAEMNRVGMVVCASHCGYRTALDLIEASASPVIFSHSNPRSVWDHPRNIPDALMRACAERGGVVGINGFGPFLGANDASTETIVRHIEYAIDKIGPDHVGIALDYVFDIAEFELAILEDPASYPPDLYSAGAQMVPPAGLGDIHEALRARGHRAADLAKIFGLNHLGIAEQIWAP